MTPQEQLALVRTHVKALREHFSDVQILACFENDAGMTERVFLGAGNHYARTGMAREYVANAENEEQAQCLAGVLKPDETDDGDKWKS